MYFEFILIQTKGAIAPWFLCTVLIMEVSLLQFIFIIVIEPPPTVLIIEVSLSRVFSLNRCNDNKPGWTGSLGSGMLVS